MQNTFNLGMRKKTVIRKVLKIMNGQSALTAIDLPESLGALKVLLLCLFMLHLIPVNLLMGGSLFLGISSLAGRKNEHLAFLGKTLTERMPFIVKLTIITAIVSVAIVKLLYSSAVSVTGLLASKPVLTVLVLLTVGLYGTFFLQGRLENRDKSSIPFAWLIAVIFIVVGIIYSWNLGIFLRPEVWQTYSSGTMSGFPGWSNPAFYPAFLHVLLGSLAVAGLWLASIGVRPTSKSQEWRSWAVDFGGKMFNHATFINMAIGIWFIIALPGDDMRKFVGANPMATHSFILAFILTGAALFAVFKARNSEQKKGPVTVGIIMLLIVFILMGLMRQQF